LPMEILRSIKAALLLSGVFAVGRFCAVHLSL